MDHLLFNKLDELLSQTQLYSEFLLEKMDDITFVSYRTVFDILKGTFIILLSLYSNGNMLYTDSKREWQCKCKCGEEKW